MAAMRRIVKACKQIQAVCRPQGLHVRHGVRWLQPLVRDLGERAVYDLNLDDRGELIVQGREYPRDIPQDVLAGVERLGRKPSRV